MVDFPWFSVFFHQFFHTFIQLFSHLAHMSIDFRMIFQDFQLCQTCGHSYRITAQSSCLIYMAYRGDHFHDLPFSAKSTYRHTGTDDFSVSYQIRLDSEPLLRTTECQTETCNYLIKDQNCTMIRTEFTKTF